MPNGRNPKQKRSWGLFAGKTRKDFNEPLLQEGVSLEHKRAPPPPHLAWTKPEHSQGQSHTQHDYISGLSVYDATTPHHNHTTFEQMYGYSWDFVMVFPSNTPEQQQSAITYMADLQEAGLQLYPFYSVQQDEILVKIRCSVPRLAYQAELSNCKILLDPTLLEKECKKGDPESNIAPIAINDDRHISWLSPFKFIYGQFSTNPRVVGLFQHSEGLNHSFDQTARNKLILDIIQYPKEQQGAEMSLRQMQFDEQLLAYYPLHNPEQVARLKRHWLKFAQWPWKQPIGRIRKYFGEKIGLYFCFLGHYTAWLFMLGLLGLAVYIDVLAENSVQATTVPYFCLLVAFWAVMVFEFWKRQEATLGLQWGMSDFEDKESVRPEFKGKVIKSFIDGSDTVYYPTSERQKLQAKSLAVILMLIVVVIAAVAGVFWLKFFMVQDDNDTVSMLGTVVPGLVNAVQIQVLNATYSKIAIFLTDQENHRTDTAYEDSLIMKMFAFQFVNSYASLYYVAFVKIGVEGDCDEKSCMDELSITLATIFLTRVISGNAIKLTVPRIMQKLKFKKETEGIPQGRVLSEPEKQYILEIYDEMMGTLEDYVKLSIQYGYVTLFVTAFPLAPIVAYLSNYIEIRTDGYKLLNFYRRPIPRGVQDIGTWQTIFSYLSTLAVVTNSALVCFTMNTLDFTNTITKVWCFFLFQYGVFGIMWVVAEIVDDVPAEVDIQLQRQEFLCSKIIDKVPDTSLDYYQRGDQPQTTITIFQNDS